MDWIQFCYKKRVENHKSKHAQTEQQKPKADSQPQNLQFCQSENFDGMSNDTKSGVSPKSSQNQTPSPLASKSNQKVDATAATQAPKPNAQSNEIVSSSSNILC